MMRIPKAKASTESSNPVKASQKVQRRKNTTDGHVASAEIPPVLLITQQKLRECEEWSSGVADAAFMLAGEIENSSLDGFEAGRIVADVSRERGLNPADAVRDFREALEAVKAGRLERATVAERKEVSSSAETAQRKQSATGKATILVQLARGAAELFHDSEGRHFASIKVAGHYKTHALRSTNFKRWLASVFFGLHNSVVSDPVLNEALRIIEQLASEGPQIETAIRVAEHDGKIYVDLCDPAWRVVEISASGWSVLTESPVRFRRAKSMLPLPEPQPGSSLAELRELINITDDDWVLFCAWLVAAFRPGFPFPVLLITGEQGSGKSNAAKFARSLVDPNLAPLRSVPRDERDLMITASNNWTLAFDNCARLAEWFSDALCRISTGGGFATRALYENDEESIFAAKRPLIINGIEDVATRSDLIDRCLVLSLPAIPKQNRRPESVINSQFAAMWPRVFGALLTAVSVALRELPSVRLTDLPRMADFALWATAAETGLGFAPGEFIRVYTQNRDESNAVLIEASPVAQALQELFSLRSRWKGTATELLAELNSRQPEADRQRKTGWPLKANTLSNQLARIAPNLRDAGIDVQRRHTKHGSLITLIRIEREADNRSNSAADDLLLMPAVSDQAQERRAVKL